MRFSYSNLKLWRKCHRAWHYKYREGLVKKEPAVPLVRGSLFHDLIDSYILCGNWDKPLQEYRERYARLWEEEADKYGSPEEVETLLSRYLNHYHDDGLSYSTVEGKVSEIEFEVEYKGIVFRGIIDKIPTDKHGRTWVMDHKTHKVIPDEETRFSDIQTVLYYWGANLAGLVQADGVLWDYIRTKNPAVPELLKKGGLTRRKNIDTDWDTYRQAILDNGLDEEDYQDMKTILLPQRDKFFKRIYLPAPNKDMVQGVVSDMIETAQEIQGSNSKTRNMTKDCKQCSYFRLCSAEVRGHDTSFIIKTYFDKKEPQ